MPDSSPTFKHSAKPFVNSLLPGDELGLKICPNRGIAGRQHHGTAILSHQSTEVTKDAWAPLVELIQKVSTKET